MGLSYLLILPIPKKRIKIFNAKTIGGNMKKLILATIILSNFHVAAADLFTCQSKSDTDHKLKISTLEDTSDFLLQEFIQDKLVQSYVGNKKSTSSDFFGSVTEYDFYNSLGEFSTFSLSQSQFEVPCRSRICPTYNQVTAKYNTTDASEYFNCL